MTQALSQLLAELQAVLGDSTTKDGLGPVVRPQKKSGNIKYLFVEPALVELGEHPLWVLPRTDKSQPLNKVSFDALRGKLLFVNLKDTVRGGTATRKVEFWLDCGSTTYVFESGWESDQVSGRVHNTTKSFLKSLSALSPEQLKKPITVALQRWVDTDGYKNGEGKENPYASKIVFMQVWDSEDSLIYNESGDVDVYAAEHIISKINKTLTGQAVLTPRPKKEVGAQPQQTYVPQSEPRQEQSFTESLVGAAEEQQFYPTPAQQPALTQEQLDYQEFQEFKRRQSTARNIQNTAAPQPTAQTYASGARTSPGF